MPHSAVFETGLRAESQIEFFDRHPALPIVLLLLFPFALQVPFWVLGLSTDPIWFYSSITTGPHVVPGSPFLDPNAGFTSQALGHLAAWDWVHGVIPWWNPYTGIGVPLAGELQPGAFFLPFSLLLLLREGVLWQRIAMQIIAGLATYALLRELGLSRLAAFLGGALFAVNGVIAWTPGPAAVYCSSPFLPCLLWGIERARKPRGGAASILAIGLAIAWSILAGFPEPAYISGLLALAWGVYRVASAPERWFFARRALGGFALGLLVTTPLLIAFVDYLLQSDSFAVHTMSGKSLPWASLPPIVLPYIYGPLNVFVDTWGSFGGYTGALVLVMALAGVMQKSADRGLKLLLLIWVLLCWARNFGVQPITAIIDHVPLLSRAIFFRYVGASWILALTILAAYGLDEFRGATPRRRNGFAIVTILLLVCTALAWPQRAFWGWSQGKALVMFAFLGAALFWALAGLAALGLAWRISQQETRRATLAGLIIFDAAVMFMAAQVSARRNNQVDLQAMQFLHDHQGLSRNYSLGPLAPNYSAYFQVAGINHNILPVPRLWEQYVDRHLLPGFQGDLGVTFFWPAWGDTSDGGPRTFSMNLANFRDVGVRYVLTNPGQSALPTIYLDAADSTLPLASGRKAPTGEPRVLAWCESVANNPAKPAAERFVMSAVAHSLRSVVPVVKDQPIVTNGTNELPVSPDENSGAVPSKNLILRPGQAAETIVPMPGAFAQSAIDGVGVLLADSAGPADGELEVRICAEEVCRSSRKSLSKSGNPFFEVHLDKPLAAVPGTPLHLTFTHEGGSRPMALAVSSGMNQQLQGPGGVLPGRRLHVSFKDSMVMHGFHKAYGDSVMDIWEVPDPAPYYEVVQGGPCTLAAEQREDVTAECSSPAKLRRRELYMPGWNVRSNGAAIEAVQQDGIFQATTLPAGLSKVRYNFTPPHMEIGWIAFLTGVVGLFLQLLRVGRGEGTSQVSRQRSDPGIRDRA
jgi:dolichol kinase